jgi:hypothetical protein
MSLAIDDTMLGDDDKSVHQVGSAAVAAPAKIAQTPKRSNKTLAGPDESQPAEPLSVRLWREAITSKAPTHDTMQPDVEVRLRDGSVLRLHGCLLARVPPYFEAALRFSQMARRDETATIDCTADDPAPVRFVIEAGCCGAPLGPQDFDVRR